MFPADRNEKCDFIIYHRTRRTGILKKRLWSSSVGELTSEQTDEWCEQFPQIWSDLIGKGINRVSKEVDLSDVEVEYNE